MSAITNLFPLPTKYRALRILGSGRMGTVVLARDPALGRLVALKFLRESCEVFLDRFRREARIMARLRHPSILPIHELDQHEGRTYLAMDYVRGGNLALPELAPRELARILRAVVDALACVHRAGIVHRDVKPENILLDRSGMPFLSDFGLALGPDEGVARVRARPVVGTPLTMSPEQARGERVGPESDQFSWGSTMYYKLTGVWPFRGRSVLDVLDAIQRDVPRRPRELCPAVPRALEALVMRCLEKCPSRRFGSMEHLGDALDRFLSRAGLVDQARGLIGRSLPRSRPTPKRIHPEALT